MMNMMKKLISVLLLAVMLVPAAMATADEPAYGYAYIVSGGEAEVNVYTDAADDAALVGQYLTGVRVRVLSPLDADWVQVGLGSVTGYMKSTNLTTDTGFAHLADARLIGKAKTNSFVNLREAPTKASASLARLNNGEEMIVCGETTDHWYYVFHGDIEGYMMKEFVTIADLANEPIIPAVPEGFVDVLTGREDFLFVTMGQETTLAAIGECLDDLPVTFTEYAVADVNQDGRPDVVLPMVVEDYPYAYLVLTEVENSIWGYEYNYRAMLSLKADGTFSFSSGASDNGFGHAFFNGGRSDITVLGESDSDGEKMTYTLNGQMVAGDVFDAAMQAQEAKPDAVWHALYLP